MAKALDKFLVLSISVVLTVAAAGYAKAATWIVTDVLQVSNGGFAASSFHDARGNEMTGSNLAGISGSGILGTYNDVTGALSISATVTQSSNSFGMTLTSSGGFLFGSNDFLAAHGTLDLTFANVFTLANSATIAAGSTTEMGFMLGDVCCSGTADPNSFRQPGGDAGERWMTLWGANNFNVANGSYDFGSETTLGMDLRLRMERSPGETVDVPEPAINAILGLGLLGLALARRRKTV